MNECIEGEVISIAAQKITPTVQRPEKRTRLSGERVTVFPFSLKQRGEGSVVQCNACGHAQYNSKSMIEMGACILGSSLWGFAEEPMGRITVGGKGRTGAHKGQSMEVKGACFLMTWEDRQGRVADRHPQEYIACS